MTRFDRLARVFEKNRSAILEDATRAVARAHLPHYEQDNPAEAEQRFGQLYDVVQQSLDQRNARLMVHYADRIAQDRLTVGFSLRELQGALNSFEEVVWRHLVVDLPPKRFAEAIGLVSTLLGAAKDALANAYVAAATAKHAEARNSEALFEGTEGA